VARRSPTMTRVRHIDDVQRDRRLVATDDAAD
jgi:hypothetical protein